MPIVIQVRRGDPNNTSLRQNPSTGPIVNLFVPPAYHFTFGMRMKMGKVAGVRDDSPAAHADVKKGDEIIKVVMLDEHGEKLANLGRSRSRAPAVPARSGGGTNTQARRRWS